MANPITDHARRILDHIHQRRTLPYTMMRPDPIDEDRLQLLFEAANWAPTHRFTEPWRFQVFRGEGRARVAKVLSETYRETSGEKFFEKKYIKAQTRPLSVPVVMAIVMEPSEKCNLPEFEEILAVGCAMQNFHLAAHALGIGCSWSTPAYIDHPNIRAFLGLEGRSRCLGFYYLGYPQEGWPSSKRGPVSEKIKFIDG